MLQNFQKGNHYKTVLHKHSFDRRLHIYMIVAHCQNNTLYGVFGIRLSNISLYTFIAFRSKSNYQLISMK